MTDEKRGPGRPRKEPEGVRVMLLHPVFIEAGPDPVPAKTAVRVDEGLAGHLIRNGLAAEIPDE